MRSEGALNTRRWGDCQLPNTVRPKTIESQRVAMPALPPRSFQERRTKLRASVALVRDIGACVLENYAELVDAVECPRGTRVCPFCRQRAVDGPRLLHSRINGVGRIQSVENTRDEPEAV